MHFVVSSSRRSRDDGAATIEDDRAVVAAPRRRVWRLATLSLVVLGLGGSCAAGAAWVSYQRTQARQQFVGRASTAAAAIDQSIQRTVDLQRAFGLLVSTMTDPTNKTLAPWLDSLDLPKSYPGSIGMTLLEPVASSALANYEQAVTDDPIPGYGNGPYAVYPPGDRSVYCLTRFGATLGANPLPAGIDECAPQLFGVNNPLPAVFAAATRTGQPQFVGLSSLLDPVKKLIPADVYRTYEGLYLVIVPVYDGGSRPTSLQARQASLMGWALSVFNGSTMIRTAVPRAQGVAIQVTSRSTVLASMGPTASKGWMSTTVPLAAGIGANVTIAQARSSAPLAQGVALGLLAALLTIVLFSFTFHLGKSRERALQLVEERTQDLRHQALHDTLTGLPNRALLFDRASQILARTRRQPRAVGALYLDLDNFKDVNDSLGPNIGDELLKAVAARLEATVRESDTVGRLGGDEFLILTEDEQTDASPELVAQRVMAVLEQPFVLPGDEPVTIKIGASIGLAAGIRASAGELIRDADVALYQAKESGKGRYATFRPEMQTAIRNRLSLEMDLGQALQRGELYLLYQPIFSLAGMTTTAVEALLRWDHPTRGVIPPGEFIPIAEQSGLIVRIGEFVLNEACAQAASWNCQGYNVGMSVNVSVAQFEADGFIEVVRDVLERNGLPAPQLTLEITESLLMHDPLATTEVLTVLKDIGVRIAIDDFGTGYSSLAYLRQFPIDSIKIDRSFIAKVSQNAQADALVHTLVQLGQALEIETVAEGIEERSQLTKLQKERCQSGQGFLYARPLPPEQLPPFFLEPDVRPEEMRPTR